jgi:hypothetical protein
MAASDAREHVIFEQEGARSRESVMQISGNEGAHVGATAYFAARLGRDKSGIEKAAEDALSGGLHDFVADLFAADFAYRFI